MINVDVYQNYLLDMRRQRGGYVSRTSGFAHHANSVQVLDNLGLGRVIVAETKGNTNIMAIYIVQHISQ